MKDKYINTLEESKGTLSRMAYALLLPLYMLSNRDNEVNKKTFQKTVNWINDARTWDKYWSELEANKLIVLLDQNVWMISPLECYTDGQSQMQLISKWNKATITGE
jgi:hypothetical protein